MAEPARPVLRVVPTEPDSPVTRLHRMVARREVLRPSFQDVWRRFETGAGESGRRDWAEASLRLFDANAGPACLIAYWQASLDTVGALGAPALAGIGEMGRRICLHAGAAAAAAAFSALPPLVRRLGAADAPAILGVIAGAAEPAPESVPEIVTRLPLLTAELDRHGFEAWVATGLRVGGRERRRRLAFFTLEDPLARRLLHRPRQGVGLSDVERPMKAFVTALWGIRAPVRGIEPADAAAPPHRVRIAGGLLMVPEVFRGVPAERTRDLYRAAFAHAGAHLSLTRDRFPVGRLKPMQIALVSLIEDARVERLAMARFPGLRRLWLSWHAAQPGGAQTAPALFARLARALIDPTYADPDDWVAKGRSLFEAAFAGRPADQALSREIGGLLGNDLGQLRIQFNAKAYVVEPAYRDDNLGLWDFGDLADAEPDVIEIALDSMRLEQQETESDGDRREEDRDGEAASRARRTEMAEDEGFAVATYPEWDADAGIERPDWATVREYRPRPGRPGAMAELLAEQAEVANRVTALVRSVKVGRPQRLKRRHEGEQLDLDATIEAEIARRGGEMPDGRIHQTKARRHRDVSAMILLDTSESTRDRVPGTGRSILDMERAATAVLAEAMAALGDPFAVAAFASNGRGDVRYTRVKDFREPFAPAVRDRLAGLEAGYSTRLGTAIRHAAAELAGQRNYRRLMIVLTDGEPSDIDVAATADGPRGLIEDARRAVVAARARGLDVFCVGLDPAGHGCGAAIFGRGNYIPVARLADLPARLAMLYFRLAVR